MHVKAGVFDITNSHHIACSKQNAPQNFQPILENATKKAFLEKPYKTISEFSQSTGFSLEECAHPNFNKYVWLLSRILIKQMSLYLMGTVILSLSKFQPFKQKKIQNKKLSPHFAFCRLLCY